MLTQCLLLGCVLSTFNEEMMMNFFDDDDDDDRCKMNIKFLCAVHYTECICHGPKITCTTADITNIRFPESSVATGKCRVKLQSHEYIMTDVYNTQ